MNNPILHHQVSGEGPPLLILHGLFGSMKNWNSLARQLSEDFQVIQCDLRNHGQSFHSQQMNYPAMAEDVSLLLEAIGTGPVDVLGHSMGGKIAMLLARQRESLVSRLVVADIAPVVYTHDFNEIIKPVMQLDLSSFGSRKEVDLALSSQIENTAVRLFLMQSLQLVEEKRLRWQINWPAIQRHIGLITGFVDITDWQITVPSLFIRGENSSYVSRNSVELIKTHFSDCSFVDIAEAGHWLHAEQPKSFYQSVRAFLT